MAHFYVVRDKGMDYCLSFFPAENDAEARYQFRAAIRQGQLPVSEDLVLEKSAIEFDKTKGFLSCGSKTVLTFLAVANEFSEVKTDDVQKTV